MRRILPAAFQARAASVFARTPTIFFLALLFVLSLIANPRLYAAEATVSATTADKLRAAQAVRMADSLRHEAGELAAQGKLNEALALVEKHAADLPAVWASMFAGKLELGGEAAARGYTGAAADSAPDQMRGEAMFRLGQYHYAAGRYHLAIPQFRLYLARHPNGNWSQESAYWMAYSCMQLAQQRPDRAAYVDTALVYLRKLEGKGMRAYYWPLARAAQARIYLLRGDTATAAHALRNARARAPVEEMPGVLRLSIQAEPNSPDADAWEDSLRWNYPLSPETKSLPVRARLPAVVEKPVEKPAPVAEPSKASPPKGYHLQLGVFSQAENAERLRKELTAKKIPARAELLRSGGKNMHRVLAGPYANAVAAEAEGKRLKSLGYDYRVLAP